MNINAKAFTQFSQRLRKIRTEGADKILAYMERTKIIDYIEASGGGAALDDFISYCYGIATKYGEASGALSAEMYDAIAQLSGKVLPPAVPAPTPTIGEIGKTVNGVLKQSKRADMVANAIGRQIKKVGAETMVRNAARDGAQFAWIPQGDTCAFCVMLASNGWQRARADDHAEHIHANCDCEYCVRFDSDTKVGGYDPGKYKAMYDEAEGDNWEEKLNSMRREAYAKNSEDINAQKRDAYEKRQERESSQAEEIRT